ncbi:MAG: hypothetical protein HC855_00045 [Rhizobiales bacterium]|nr:hypothetical protein [Hyphomicrobiales bacterium]
MTRNAVEAPPTANRVVRTQRHSLEARGSEAAKFAKTMANVQSLNGSVRGGAEDRFQDLEARVGKPANDASPHDTSGLDLRFAPQLGPFAQDADALPDSPLASSLHKPGVEDRARMEPVEHDFAGGDRLYLSVPRSSVMVAEVPEFEELFDSRASEKQAVKHLAENASLRSRNFEIEDSEQGALVSDPLGDLANSDGTPRRIVLLPPVSEQIPKPNVASTIAGELPRHRPDTGGKVPALHPNAQSASRPQAEDRFDRMSVRVEFSGEPTLVVKESEEDVEFTGMSQWDAASKQLRHEAAPGLVSTTEPGHEAAPESAAGRAVNEDMAPTEWPVSMRSGNSVLTANVTSTVAGRLVTAPTADDGASPPGRLKMEMISSASQPYANESADLVPARVDFGAIPFVQAEMRGSMPASNVQLGDRAVSALATSDPAPRTGSAAERPHEIAAERVAQTPGMPMTTDNRDFSPPAFDAPDSKPASTGAMGTHGSRGSTDEKSTADAPAPILTGPERLPPAAGSPSPRSDWPTRIPIVFGVSVPSRQSTAPEASHVVHANVSVEPEQHGLRAVNAERAESVGSRRDGNEKSFPLASRESSATGSKGNATHEDVPHDPPEANASAIPSPARFSPLASYDSAQSAGQAAGGHANGAPSNSLGQVLQTLQLELSALKKTDSSPLKQLKIRLHPESLGEVDVTLKKNGRGIEVQLEATLGSTASALQVAKDELASALAELGFDRGSLSIEVRASGQAESQHETLSGRDWQQARPDIDPRNLAEQQSDRRRERKLDEGLYEEAERGSPANPDGLASRSRRGIYV